LIPNAVWQEVVVKGAGQPGAQEVRNSRWIQRKDTSNPMLVLSLRRDLDRGESEAIVLAIEEKALLLIDERRGRATAEYLGLPVLGLVGVLVQAKRKGLLQEIRPLLDRLRTEVGFFISGVLYERVCKDVNE
jgi:predicted nucleic acid-binding protein